MCNRDLFFLRTSVTVRHFTTGWSLLQQF